MMMSSYRRGGGEFEQIYKAVQSIATLYSRLCTLEYKRVAKGRLEHTGGPANVEDKPVSMLR